MEDPKFYYQYIVNASIMDLKNNFKYTIWVDMDEKKIDMSSLKINLKGRWLGSV